MLLWVAGEPTRCHALKMGAANVRSKGRVRLRKRDSRSPSVHAVTWTNSSLALGFRAVMSQLPLSRFLSPLSPSQTPLTHGCQGCCWGFTGLQLLDHQGPMATEEQL